MTNPVGSFIWYELLTTDLAGAADFYQAAVGFAIADADDGEVGMADIDYRMIVRDDGGFAGGAMALTGEMTEAGARPGWLPYLYVEDVDAALAAIIADGGAARMPATDLPGVGRVALLTDTQGVPIYLMTPNAPPGREDMESDVFDPDTPQHVRWNELASPDQAGSMAFYARHFGFGFDDRMSMGPAGDYCFIGHHGRMLGGIMARHDETQPALWLFYFGVPSLMAGKAAVEANGGTVLMGPHEVPGGDWVIVATDPQGAAFGLVGPRGE